MSKWSLESRNGKGALARNGAWGIQMEPGTFKWSLGRSNGAWENQMEPRRLKRSLGGPNDPWEVQMKPVICKWSLYDCHVISFNKNNVQMEPGTSKWSLGGPNGALTFYENPALKRLFCIGIMYF